MCFKPEPYFMSTWLRIIVTQLLQKNNERIILSQER